MRVPIWTTVLTLLGGVALATPPIDAPLPEPRFEPASGEAWTPSEGGALVELVQPLGTVLPDEGIQIARKSRSGKDGGRGGARSKSRGGFSKGNERSARRSGGGGRGGRSGDRASGGRGGESGGRGGDRGGERDVHVDADDLDDAHTSDEEKVGAALVGGVIGLGVGKMISDSEDPE